MCHVKYVIWWNFKAVDTLIVLSAKNCTSSLTQTIVSRDVDTMSRSNLATMSHNNLATMSRNNVWQE